MTQYTIRGGSPLYGDITVSGAKNAALAVLPATLLVDGICVVENVPNVNDVTLMEQIMRKLGAKIRRLDGGTLEIDSRGVRPNSFPPYEQARRMRASYYLLGAYLGRFSSAGVAMPGGCNLGVRPVDQHIKGFEALGADVRVKAGVIHADAREGRLSGASIYLDVASVGATINIMLAATTAEGTTHIENAAREPHVVDLANFLNSAGADVMGAGTDVIKIRGRKNLRGGTYTIIPDQIEAGTYMTAVAAAGGEVTLNNVIPKHLECITVKLAETGVEVDEYDDSVVVRRRPDAILRKTNVKTHPYPGFPTDMQPQITACLCYADGISMITESVTDSRYRYVDELRRMGARIRVDGKLAIVEGARSLTGAPVQACDLRAGAALIVAALGAQGITDLSGVFHVERGYENIVEKLRGVGADIRESDAEERQPDEVFA